MRKMEERAIRDILTDENIERIERTDGLSLEFVLHLYHKTGRNPKKLNEAIQSFFEDNEELLELVERQIDNLEEQIKITKEVRKGLLQDKVKGKI